MDKIAFIDLEGTLVEGSAWNVVKGLFGASKLSSEYEKLYEDGKVSYHEWRRKLVEIWRERRISRKEFVNSVKDYKLMPGARGLIVGLQNKGFKVVVLTGAISFFAEIVCKDLGIDEFYSAHEFIFDPKGYFLDIKEHAEYGRGKGKVYFMKKVIAKEDADIRESIAIGGDDINDYWMLKFLKSFSVKPCINKIKEVVDYEVDSLRNILDFV